MNKNYIKNEDRDYVPLSRYFQEEEEEEQEKPSEEEQMQSLRQKWLNHLPTPLAYGER